MRNSRLIVSVIFLVMAMPLFMAWPFMWIWNYAVVSAVTVTAPIGYWTAFWLMVFVIVWLAGSNSRRNRDWRHKL